MNVLLVYDVTDKKCNKIKKVCNKYLNHIQNSVFEGLAFIDPHGKTADLLLEYVPKERIKDVIHIAPFDTEFPISFNVLEHVEPDKRHLVVSGLMSTFKKIWVDAWSARMEYILTNTLLSLLEYPGATLLGVNKMLSDKEYRKDVIAHITDPSVKAFWVKEFANYSERMAQDAVPAIQNKVGQFTANPLIRNMIGQPDSTFDIRRAMDEGKIIIINLSKGKIGDENMKLLGGMLVTKIYLAAMSRADVPDRILKTLPNFYLYVDEFQNFANASFADILSEARKYKLNLTIAHQYIEQMDDVVRAAVFGNVGTMIVFRIGATDAEALEKEFAPEFTVEDLVNLGFTQIYLKLMIDGLTSPPFSAMTLPPIPHPEVSFVNEIVQTSRQQFAQPRAIVEEMIIKFHESNDKKTPDAPSQKPKKDSKFVEYVVPDELKEKAKQKDIIKANDNVKKDSPSVFHTEDKVVAQNESDSKAEIEKVVPTQTTKNQNTNNSRPDFGQSNKPISFNKNSNYREYVRPVSLEQLKAKPHQNNNIKMAQPDQVNSLKKAIEKALAEKKNAEVKNKEQTVADTVNQTVNREPVVFQKKESKNTQEKEITLDEVPKEILEKVLKMED
jgi:CRISPR/Cas system-associated endoribonuclease Cas2